MLFKLRFTQTGVFQKDFRRQLLATFSVTIITFCHGIGLGWLSPTLRKLNATENENSPLQTMLSVEQISWIGALLCAGGFVGIIFFGCTLDRIGRKRALYLLALPHMLQWVLLYFADSVEYFYAARICGGVTGGGVYVVIPIFIGEIADSAIRGRLTSAFTLTLNTGILVGFILATGLPYRIIPYVVVPLPILYFYLATRFPETAQHLLRKGCENEAKESLKFYRNYRATSKSDIQQFNAYYEDLKAAVLKQQKYSHKLTLADFFCKKALMAICTGIVLMLINTYCGFFAIINYMSLIFTTIKVENHSDTNTIIIGAVQIIGTYAAINLVDRFGRKLLLIISMAGMGIGLAFFGLYAFFAEETNMDLTHFSWWLPLVLVASIIFISNVGIVSVTFVVLVEILPPKIRVIASSVCIALLSLFAFAMLKLFPAFVHSFGLAATMWFCASVCAFGLFYVTVFLEETKGKSIDKDEQDN